MKKQIIASILLFLLLLSQIGAAQISQTDKTDIRKAEDVYQQGESLEKEGQLDRALEQYKKVIRLDPNNHNYLASAGHAAGKLGFSDQAVEYYWKAIDLAIKDKNFNKIDDYNNKILETRKTIPQWAKEITDKASKLPDTPEIKTALKQWKQLDAASDRLTRTGDYKQAEEKLAAAIEIAGKNFGENHPHYLTSLYLRGECYYHQGLYSEAEKLLIIVLEKRKILLGVRHPVTLVALGNLATIHAQQGRYTEAESLMKNALRLRIKALGENHPDTLNSLNNLAVLYRSQGRYAEAEPLIKKALKLRTEVLGENHPDTLSSLNHLSNLYSSQGRYAEAETISQNVLILFTAVLGEKHQQSIHAINNLAVLYHYQGQYSKAEPLYQKALALSIEVFGEKHPTSISIHSSLASLYSSQGRYTEAEPFFKKALKLSTTVLGEKHPDTLLTLNNLAGLYRSQGQYAEAESLIKKALKLRIEALGENHPHVLVTLNGLAMLYGSQGRYAEAESLYEKVLKLSTAVLGEKHPNTLGYLNNLAVLYLFQGRYAEAEPLYQKVLKLKIEVLGEKHPNTLTSLGSLAALYSSQGRYAEAEPLLQKVLKLKIEVLGEKHPDTLGSMNGLAVLYWSQGRYAEAEPLLQKVLKLSTEVLGEKHPNALLSLNNLAGLYSSQGRYADAEPLIKKALKLRTEVLGEKHPDTLFALNSLASLYDSQGRYAEAEPLLKIALKLRIEVLGERHPDTLLSLNNLAELYNSQDRYTESEPLHQKALKLSTEVLGKRHPNTSTTLSNLAWLYQKQAQLERAEPLWQLYLRQKNQFLESVLWGAGEATRQSYLKQEEPYKNNLLSFYLHRNSREMSEEAFYFSLTRKGLLLRIAAEINAVARSGSHPQLAEKALKLQQKKQELSNLTLSGPGDKAPENHQQHLKQLESEIYNLEAALGRDVQQLSRAKTEVTPQTVIKALQSNEVLIDFLAFKQVDLKKKKVKKDHLIALLVDKTSKQPIRVIDLGDLNPVSDLVKQYREQLKNPDDFSSEDLKLTSQELYQKLWQPLSAKLEGKKRVYLVPDGVLHLLPFSTLQDQKGRYLSELKELVVLSSGRDLVVPLSTGELKEPAVLSSPYFDPSQKKEYASVRSKQKRTVGTRVGDLYFTPLPGTAIEGDQITKMWQKKGSKPTTFAYETATEQNLKTVTAPKVLHLATHGFFLDAVPTKKNAGKDLKRATLIPVAIETTASQSAVHSTKTATGVIITEVFPGNQGESVGLMVGDKIIQYAGETIRSRKDLVKLSQGMKGYKEIEVVFLRKNRKKKVVLEGGTIGVSITNASDYGSKKQALTIRPKSYKKEENPLLRSGLALTGANEGVKANFSSKEDDGIFTAMEALGLDLNGTELVVLSACETGVGSIKQGEGVYGLRRAFQEAGAHAVLSTLWTISDEGTQVFMEKFYTRFLNGEKPQTALRNTQLEFMHSEDWSHPFYWAPFVMVGKE